MKSEEVETKKGLSSLSEAPRYLREGDASGSYHAEAGAGHRSVLRAQPEGAASESTDAADHRRENDSDEDECGEVLVRGEQHDAEEHRYVLQDMHDCLSFIFLFGL